MGALSQFLSGVTERFCKIKSIFFSFRVLAGGFVIGYAKKFWFSANIKSSRKVCNIRKSLRSQTKVWRLAALIVLHIELCIFISVVLHNKTAFQNEG